MDQMAKDFAEQAHFLFVYVREAHPDDDPAFPVHNTIEQKMEHARTMQKKHGTPRKILVDSLDGDVHREFGGIPNMSWIIDHTGQVAYKAGWTIAPEIRDAMDDAVRVRQLKREASEKGVNFRTYYKESVSALRSGRAAP
jgi:hypothetical protein